jgi:hypothetical protein
MKKIIITIVILLIVVTVAVALVLSSQPPADINVAGVAPGDTFTFDLKGYSEILAEDPTNVTIPPGILELNNTQWYKVAITAVSGPEVSFNTTLRFLNGTEIEEASTINLLTGINNPPFWTLYQANLTVNNYVHPEGPDGVYVNQTETKSYKSGTRETNFISLQRGNIDAADPTRTYDDFRYIRFDKLTGMLVDFQNLQIYSDPVVILRIEWKLIESNVWTV